MTIRPMILARDLGIICFCAAVFIGLVSLSYESTSRTLASYDRNQPSNLNMGKILAVGSILREFKGRKEQRDIDNREIKWWMAKTVNYNSCMSKTYYDDVCSCVDAIAERDVALVRLAMTSPESFEVNTR